MDLSFVALLIVISVIFLSNKWKNGNQQATSHNQNLPPGPMKLPIIGDLHRLISSVPFRSFRDLAETYGPLMHLKLCQISVIIVSSPEVAKVVLKEQDPCFAGRIGLIALEIVWYNYAGIVFSDYGDYWRQMRKICIIEILSSRNVRSFGHIRNGEVSRLVNTIKLSDGKPITFTDMIFMMTSSVTCRAAFGKVCNDSDTLISLLRETLNLGAGFCISDLFPSSKIISALDWRRPKLLKMRRKLDTILDGIINEHKVNLAKLALEDEQAAGKCRGNRRGNGEFGNEDLVDVLLRVKEEEELAFPINNDNIKAVLFDIFAGGTETSSTIIDWTMTELIRKPSIMANAQADVREVFDGRSTIKENDVQKLKYLKLIVKESLRLHPPAPLIVRGSREEASVNGYHIPAKARVLVNNWAIQRDPKYWDNPESFVPERFENNSINYTGGDFEFLPFGAGKRMCPGMTFGMANIELPLAQLLNNFNWKLPDGADPNDLNMLETFGLTAARKDSLFVVATPYH